MATTPGIGKLAAVVQAAMDSLFLSQADSTFEGDYYRSGNTLVKAGVTFLAMPMRASECDGVTVKAGDVKLLMRVNDLGVYAFERAVGDNIQTELQDGNVSFEVIAGAVDFAWVYWTLYCRRNYGQGA